MRERRSCFGELIQIDGSPHDWFEGRGEKCCLLVFIDDATSEIQYGEFITVEDTENLLRCTREYLLIHGRPVEYYVDRDSIYKVNRQSSVDEELRDENPLTQFTRAMKELGINMIFANSPQAKGRVERGFKTHQNRLVKELRLAGISDMKRANEFLKTVYIPRHNARFAIAPARPLNSHRPLLKTHRLDEILCKKTIRTLANDYTLRYKNLFLQVTAEQPVRIRPGNSIVIEQRLDAHLYLKFKEAYLSYKTINKQPYKGFYATNKAALKRISTPPKGSGIPAKNHPWRQYAVIAKQLLKRQTTTTAT